VPRYERGNAYEGIKLKKICDRILQLDFLFTVQHYGIIQINVLGQTAFNEKKNEKKQKKSLANTSYPDQMG
jgi:hypothetical protein